MEQKFTMEEVEQDTATIRKAIEHFESKYPKDFVTFILSKGDDNATKVTCFIDKSVLADAPTT